MQKNTKRIIVISGILFSVFLMWNGKLGDQIFRASVLSVVNEIAEAHKPTPPALDIKDVALEKSGAVSRSSHKYLATIVLQNDGGRLKNDDVTIKEEYFGKKHKVKNDESGFTLSKNYSESIYDFELGFDAKYNGGKLKLNVDVADNQTEGSYEIPIFELPAAIIPEITDVDKNGAYVFSIDQNLYLSDKYDYVLLVSNSAKINQNDETYHEKYVGGAVYEYTTVPNSKHYVFDPSFLPQEFDSEVIKYKGNPGEYFYIKVVDKQNGFYAVSDLVGIQEAQPLNRAEAAKVISNYVKMNRFDVKQSFYSDVAEEDWFFTYVQTLYNLGLLDTDSTEYHPSEIMTRERAARIVMDFYDADLSLKGANSFQDVTEESTFYPYAFDLAHKQGADFLGDYFAPEAPATKKFIVNLINVYQKNN